jgi:hypothetical protein
VADSVALPMTHRQEALHDMPRLFRQLRWVIHRQRRHWNSLEVAKLISSLATPILIAFIGYQINLSFRAADAARDEQARMVEKGQIELAKTEEEIRIRQQSVERFSQYIYERRTRSELLLSGLKRHARDPTELSKNEVVERKRLYDDAYVKWNANNQANLFLIRQVLGMKTYTTFEQIVETRLVGKIFNPLDACLTRAYDAAIRNSDPMPILDACDAKDLVQQALDCGYAVTDQLFQLSAGGENRFVALNKIDQRCPAITIGTALTNSATQRFAP